MITDNEIIKALGICGKGIMFSMHDCKKCPYYTELNCERKCKQEALDLINRQKAEIENLRMVLEAVEDHLHPLPFELDYDKAIEQAKAEAIKECLEWVLSLFPEDKTFTTISRFTIKQKLKEMVGDV